MGEKRARNYIEDIEGQMQAAAALVESLEEEVASLRRDLEQASVALRSAQEEVSAREAALEAKEQARQELEAEVRGLSGTLAGLRTENSDEQLLLTNQHVSEISWLQERFHGRLWEKIEAALSTGDAEALKAEYGGIREAMKQAYLERIEPLESSYREARDLLLETGRQLDRHRPQEIETLRKEMEKRLRSQRKQLSAQFDEQLENELEKAAGKHEKELDALREAAAELEQEIRQEYETSTGSRHPAPEAGRESAEAELHEAEERHREELHRIKSLAENREQELRKTHAARLSEAKAEADRRVEALQSQREADNQALQEGYEEELSNLRALQEEPRAAEPAENGDEAQPRPDGPDAGIARLEERVRELEARLAEARAEERLRAEELERATDSLRRFSEPEHRLRDGIAEFNASEHARHVASISKSLGLPKVHAGISGGAAPGKPVFTFVWEGLSWRRYATEPVEGIGEPRVYLVGGGDDPEEMPNSEAPNARIDSQGRMILGVQAR